MISIDLRLEAHVEHPVGLVEDEDADCREVEEATVSQILKTAGRRDEDVRSSCAICLRLQGHPAVHSGYPKAVRGRDRREILGDLNRELPRRDEDERARAPVLLGRALDDRNREREGLARPGRRLCEHIEARERVREDKRLNGERLVNRACGERV